MCSVSLGAPDLEITVCLSKHSAPVRQVVKNSGNLMLAAVELAAMPWRGGGDSGGAVLVGLHALAIEASAAGRGGVYSTWRRPGRGCQRVEGRGRAAAAVRAQPGPAWRCAGGATVVSMSIMIVVRISFAERMGGNYSISEHQRQGGAPAWRDRAASLPPPWTSRLLA